MKIAISGHKGYIGSHVWDKMENIATLTGCDIKDIPANKRLVSNRMQLEDLAWNESDAFVHLAAQISVPESFDKPSEYVYHNLTLLDIILKKCRTEHFVFVSSVSVLEPNNPYSMTKLLGEHMVMKSGIPYTILRLSNVAGVNPKFKDKINNKHLIGAACKAIKENKSIRIFGHDYDTYDGTCIRDYIHVEDVAQVIKFYAMSKTPSMDIQYVVNGKQYSNLQIANKIRKFANSDIPFILEACRINDVPFYDIPLNAGSHGPIKDIDTIIESVYNNT